MNRYISVCIGLYHYVCDCIVCIVFNLYLSVCIWMYLHVSQLGLTPMSRDQYSDFSFSNGNSVAPTLRLENSAGSGKSTLFRCAQEHAGQKNWTETFFYEQNCFIAAARRAPRRRHTPRFFGYCSWKLRPTLTIRPRIWFRPKSLLPKLMLFARKRSC